MSDKPVISPTEQPQNGKASAFRLHFTDDNIAIVTLDAPDEKVNTLKAEFAEQITALLKRAQLHPQLKGVVFVSGKKDSFIAGADISMISRCEQASEAEALAKQGQAVMAYIAGLSVPVVAAINGACLGGGLELALACHSRICSLADETRLGLPEVQLGLLPGSGGTQRLPRLIGVAKALDLMLTGRSLRPKQALRMGLVDDIVPQSILLHTALDLMLTGRSLRPKQALRMGLVDDIVPQSILLHTALEQVRKGHSTKKPLSYQDRVMQGPLGKKLLFHFVRKQTRAKSKGHYPATEKIIDVVETGLNEGSGNGYQAEARAFGELVMTPQSAALRALFFASTALKKDFGAEAEPREIHHVGVLGGGLMGGGIAYVTATRAQLPVRIKDISQQGISHSLKYSWDLLQKKVQRGHLTRAALQKQMTLLSGSTDYSGFRQADLVVEAVFEDLALKQQTILEVEQNAAPHTIFASNTSSLPIHKIAQGAARPEQVIGLHYFSPVDKMPLVEVIPHAGTSAQTIATAVAFARKQGKTAIVVGDNAGFYVNRILAPYINEATRCLLEGEGIEHIDDALLDFGFPVGPLQLLDEVGIDVGTKIVPVLVNALGERFAAPPELDVILNDERKGRKNGRGFYLYPDKGRKSKKRQADPSIYGLLHITAHNKQRKPVIAERCLALMLNEAVRCLDDGTVRTVRDADIGAVYGIGFPPFLGGPMRYIDTLGAANLVKKLQDLQQKYGDRFAPCEGLVRRAAEGQKLYS